MIFWPLMIAGNALSLWFILRRAREEGIVFPMVGLAELLFIMCCWFVLNAGIIVLYLVGKR